MNSDDILNIYSSFNFPHRVIITLRTLRIHIHTQHRYVESVYYFVCISVKNYFVTPSKLNTLMRGTLGTCHKKLPSVTIIQSSAATLIYLIMLHHSLCLLRIVTWTTEYRTLIHKDSCSRWGFQCNYSVATGEFYHYRIRNINNKTHSVPFSLQARYTEWATAVCQRC